MIYTDAVLVTLITTLGTTISTLITTLAVVLSRRSTKKDLRRVNENVDKVHLSMSNPSIAPAVGSDAPIARDVVRDMSTSMRKPQL